MGRIDILGAALAAAASAALIVYGLIRARTDWLSGSATQDEAERADVRAAIELKNEVIGALREANEELRAQNRSALEREERWIGERAEYERRLAKVEDAFQTVVTAVANAGICALASTCPNYSAPGDRRSTP